VIHIITTGFSLPSDHKIIYPFLPALRTLFSLMEIKLVNSHKWTKTILSSKTRIYGNPMQVLTPHINMKTSSTDSIPKNTRNFTTTKAVFKARAINWLHQAHHPKLSRTRNACLSWTNLVIKQPFCEEETKICHQNSWTVNDNKTKLSAVLFPTTPTLDT
jgi:hypothetical protein